MMNWFIHSMIRYLAFFIDNCLDMEWIYLLIIRRNDRNKWCNYDLTNFNVKKYDRNFSQCYRTRKAIDKWFYKTRKLDVPRAKLFFQKLDKPLINEIFTNNKSNSQIFAWLIMIWKVNRKIFIIFLLFHTF